MNIEDVVKRRRVVPPSINITAQGNVISRVVIVLERSPNSIDNANPKD